MNTALLIIDVQRALCSGEEEAFESRRVIDRINAVAGVARNAGVPVVMIQHEEENGSLEYGSEGWKLDPELDTGPDDIYVRKTTPDSFHDTELQNILERHEIKQLVICGLQSECCVDATTRRALALGYPVTLVSDAHTTMDTAALKAPQISAQINEGLAGGSFGARIRVIPATEVRIEA
jgi:nicotinamidase-related amidase